jgi:diaminopimelate decarboxylase
VKEGVNTPFVIVDAAMNDLARPALYGSWHDFLAVEPNGEKFTANIVGPICDLPTPLPWAAKSTW